MLELLDLVLLLELIPPDIAGTVFIAGRSSPGITGRAPPGTAGTVGRAPPDTAGRVGSQAQE